MPIPYKPMISSFPSHCRALFAPPTSSIVKNLYGFGFQHYKLNYNTYFHSIKYEVISLSSIRIKMIQQLQNVKLLKHKLCSTRLWFESVLNINQTSRNTIFEVRYKQVWLVMSIWSGLLMSQDGIPLLIHCHLNSSQLIYFVSLLNL